MRAILLFRRSRTVFGAGAPWLPAVLAAFLCSCRALSPLPALESPTSVDLLGLPWAHSWSGDAECVALERLDQGVLRVSFRGKQHIVGKGDILQARLSGWRLTAESRITLVAAALDSDVEFALALTTDQYYESPRRRVPAGREETLVFDLSSSDFKSARSQWRHADSIEHRSPLETVELVLYAAAGRSHTLLITAAALEKAKPPMTSNRPQASKLALLDLAPGPAQVPRFGLYEIAARIAPAYANPFDPDDVRVDAVFTSPSGQERVCPAFLYAFAAGRDGDTWRVRFSPDEVGEWTWVLRGAAGDQRIASRPHRFLCTPSATRGPIRVSAAHPTLFEHADGTYFYPIGHNTCWNGWRDYEEQFQLMSEHGENWSRVWIAPWNCDIEWSSHRAGYEGLGRYSLAHAAKLDHLVSLAERHGLYLQLVLHEHCRVSARTNPEWQNNPYNRALGGPCEQPRDFFTNEEARRLTRNRLRYIVARWGYSSHVMAWELFNEADLSDDFDPAVDAAWHREMSEYLKATDPHRRMVCTSHSARPNAEVYRLPSIDYLQSHVYTPDLPRVFHEVYQAYAPFGKPHFVAEFGRSTEDGADAADTEGRVLHAGLWIQFMLPSGGNAMSWWWYDLIHPRHLYGHFAALARFAEGVDRRAHAWSRQTGRVTDDRGRHWHVLGLADTNAVLLWMYDPEIFPWSEKPMSAAGFAGTLVMEHAGEDLWIVEQWDTHAGRTLRTAELEPTGGTLRIPVSSDKPDTALRLFRRQPAAAGDTPQIVHERWDPLGERARPREQIAVPRLEAPPTIDGDLNDWGAFPAFSFAPSDGRAPDDHGVAFSLGHVAGDLYVGVRVTDDAFVRQNRGQTLWKDDCIELWIDSRFDGGYFCNMPHNPGCYQINVAPAGGDGYPLEHIVYRHPTKEHLQISELQAASRRTEAGYEVEVKVPLAILRDGAPADEHGRVGFNLSSCDADPEGDRISWHHLLWQGTQEYDATQWSIATLEP